MKNIDIRNKNMNMTFDTIAFSKGYLRLDTNVFDPSEETTDYEVLAANMNPTIISIQAEFMRYGYMLDENCIKYLIEINKSYPGRVDNLINSIKDYLTSLTGDGIFTSLFGNFPNNVLMMSEQEMFIHQIIHYLSDGLYSPSMPSCDDQELRMLNDRFYACVRDNYHLIKLINNKDFASLLKNIIGASQSLTPYDKEVVAYTSSHYDELLYDVDYNDIFPDVIPFKETLCIVMANNPDFVPNTITDILRYAVYLSGGDISLPNIPTFATSGWSRMTYNIGFYKDLVNRQRDAFKFKKFTRAERRDILGKIEALFISIAKTNKNVNTRYDNVYADMKKYIGRWTRLGEILHPGEYINKYPNTAEAFTMLRTAGQYITTFNGRLVVARESNDIDLLLKIYSERPGEFARNIDQLLRNYPSYDNIIIDAFSKVVSEISIKMLYELIEHFNKRNDEVFRLNRYVTPKGARSAFKLPDLEPISDTSLFVLMNLLTNELKTRFATKESLLNKKFFIENTVSNVLLPSQMRTMNVAKGQLPRGSKIPIKCDTGILRAYVRWMDPHGEYDLDLSTTMLSDDFSELYTISWNNHYMTQKGGKWAIFSGDVRHRVGNCAEYIDVKINDAIKYGVRYLVLSVCDYDGGGFDIKDAWGGVMERASLEKEGCTTWSPDTIATGFKLMSNNTNTVMTVIDLKDMCMYVVDEDFAGIPVASCNNNKLSAITQRYVNAKHYFNVESLIRLNIISRSGEVEFISSDKLTELANTVKKNKGELLELKKSFEELIDTAEKTSGSENISLRKKLDDINHELEIINNTKILTYDDITSDYTKIFEWMF